MRDILIAEDNALLAKGICTALKSERYRVRHVADGAAALAAIAEQRSDVLLAAPAGAGVFAFGSSMVDASTLTITASDGTSHRIQIRSCIMNSRECHLKVVFWILLDLLASSILEREVI